MAYYVDQVRDDLEDASPREDTPFSLSIHGDGMAEIV